MSFDSYSRGRNLYNIKGNKENKSYQLNLSKILPFELALSEKVDSLFLHKVDIKGAISLDTLFYELGKNYPYIENLRCIQVKDNTIFLLLESNTSFNLEEFKESVFRIISSNLFHNLFNTATKKPLTYITNDFFGFPLLGSIYFGVIDRGTNLIQVRSITGCPLNCPFCSVDEGPASKSKTRDFIVDTDYLVNSYNFVVEKKNLKVAEAHLDGQGEPMAYPYLVELVQKLLENKSTKVVSLQTNGWYLTEQIISELAEAKLTRINLSINTLNYDNGKKLAGRGEYNLKKILQMSECIANSDISLLIAPIWLPGINDIDIEEIIQFSMKINKPKTRYPILGIQNYLYHDEGRNFKGITQITFRDFYQRLRELEKKHGVDNLVLKPYMFNTIKTQMLPTPMKENEVVVADIVLPGRKVNEVLALSQRRIIHVSNASNLSIGRKAKIRIIRNKHNIFFGLPA